MNHWDRTSCVIIFNNIARREDGELSLSVRKKQNILSAILLFVS